MLSGRLKARVVAATVRMTKEGGRGVFVPGGYILTAAHCIHRWSGPAGTAQKDYKLESVKTRDGRELTARVLALDPVVDIAALGPVPYIGALDDLALPEEGIAFAQFGLDGVPLGRKSTLSDKPFPVYIFTHKGNWLTGSATAGSYDGTLFVSTDEGIVGGVPRSECGCLPRGRPYTAS
jgi:hypothetical protein